MDKKLYILCLFLISPFTTFLTKAQQPAEQTRTNYLHAKEELEDMLNGKKTLSYEKAIFTIENAFYDNRINYNSFKMVIDNDVAFIGKMAKGCMSLKTDEVPSNNFWDKLRQHNNETKGFHENLVKNWAIFAFMTDSLLVVKSDNNIYTFEQEPLHYSVQDPLGTNDWTNTQVTKLFFKRTGNCFALASLFKIYSKRLNSDANICTAPSHVYITHKDYAGRQFNIEVAGRVFPGIGTLSTLTHTTQEAIINDISLRELTTRHSIALCLVYLAKGYEYKNQLQYDDGFMMACANSALHFDSLSLNAMLLKAEILEKQLIRSRKTIAELQGDKTFRDYQYLISHIYKLGYREMPLYMKNILIKGWMRDSITHLTVSTPMESGDRLPATRKASLSWGVFEEEITDKPLEKYGRTVFDTRKAKIVKFTPEERLYNNYNFDPVVFAWNIDPMAHKFPHTSPYNFVENNPISRIDPDGADWIVSTYKDKHGQTQINLTFAGAVMNSSGKKIDMNKYIANEVRTFEKVFGQGNVHANLRLREIKSTQDLKWHESLIDIQAGSQFKKSAGGSVGGDSRYGGKFIRINADGIDANGVTRDRKTTVHEIGHTGGLAHPFEFDEKQQGTFVNGNPFTFGVQIYHNTENDIGLEANFMNYTGKAMEAYPMSKKSALQSYFENNVGPATRGQTQTIINNLYEGNLNSDKDLPQGK